MKRLLILPLLPCLALAQEPVDLIEIIEVIGRDTSTVTLPAEEQTEGLFGLSQRMKDIPRAATVINEDLMRAGNIETLHDIARFAPNSYAAAGFGNPSLPTLRGQLGELFQLGMRRQAGNNGLGIPLSFNAVEGIAVIKGAPPVMLGTTQRVGGFVNLQPKTAKTSQPKTSIAGKWGQWQQTRLQLDHNQVLEQDKQALRVSAEYIDEGSFYQHHTHRSDDVLIAYKWQPNRNTTFDVSLEYYDVSWTDNAGFNRPTQNLIDHNRYITGQGVQPNGSRIAGAGAVISPTGEIVIDRSNTLTDPLDSNTATTTLLHAKLQHWLTDDMVLVNRSYYQYLEREGINQNSFVEIIDGAHTFENRFELHIDQKTIVGLSLRVNDVLGYSQFTTEADNPIDLTGPLSNRRISLTAEQQARLVELRPGIFVSPGAQYDITGDGVGDFNLSDTTDSTSYQWGIFGQHKQALTDKLSATVGIRADYYDVKAADPLPPAGRVAQSDTHTQWLTAGSLALQYEVSNDLTWYATFHQGDSTSNSMAGGNVLNAAGIIDPQNFATENTLYEMGLKYAPADARWYADATVFEQSRSLRNRDGSNSGINTSGLELQWHYAAAQGYWLTLAGSYFAANWDNSASFQETRQIADAFDNSRPDIIAGTGLGSPNFTAFPVSNRRLQGMPQVQASLVAGWPITETWSVGGDVSYTKHYPLDFLQTVYIRDQHHLNLYTEYQFSQQLTVRFNVFNATDQDNWAPVFEGGFFGATLAFPSAPRQVQLSARYTF